MRIMLPTTAATMMMMMMMMGCNVVLLLFCSHAFTIVLPLIGSGIAAAGGFRIASPFRHRWLTRYLHIVSRYAFLVHTPAESRAYAYLWTMGNRTLHAWRQVLQHLRFQPWVQLLDGCNLMACKWNQFRVIEWSHSKFTKQLKSNIDFFVFDLSHSQIELDIVPSNHLRSTRFALLSKERVACSGR